MTNKASDHLVANVPRREMGEPVDARFNFLLTAYLNLQSPFACLEKLAGRAAD